MTFSAKSSILTLNINSFVFYYTFILDLYSLYESSNYLYYLSSPKQSVLSEPRDFRLRPGADDEACQSVLLICD